MSGLTFTILLAAASLTMLEGFFRDLGFRRIGDEGWHGRIHEGKRPIDVYVKKIGDRLQLLLPDASIPREICEGVVKQLASKLYAEVEHRPLDPSYVEIVGPTPSFCHYCLREVYMPYRCPRCGGYYCSEHRLPWRHDCPGDGGKASAMAQLREAWRERREAEAGRILVKEIPCG